MEGTAQLAGKRIAVLAADGYERSELESATAALKAAGAACAVVALRAGRIRGMNVQQPADLLRVGLKVEDARAADFDGLLIPGGYIGPDLLRQSAAARAFVQAFDAAAKPIAAMSHAALVLVSAGLAKGRTLTSWPGVRDDLVNAGATWINRAVVRDGRFLFSRTPQDAAAFALELAPFLAGAPQAALGPLDNLDESDPAQQAATEPPDQSLRWLAAPSLGAMLSLAILGVGVVAANSRRKRGDKNNDGETPASTPAASQAALSATGAAAAPSSTVPDA
ncbi:DJ-1/PfpI family protein [Massilia sp. 9096]|uniref:DJ-1/PfpI family protein n=1 Tax=Massilia sp. 9096 TaxID=1500894 RepID=UPI0009DF1850|nr:DJ-1/PfpI family protein [Massilia sp. 9096]